MMEVSQIIEVNYANVRQWFKVMRFTTIPELHAALIKDGISDFTAKTEAHTACYPFPSKADLAAAPAGKDFKECGRMYLLDKSIETLAAEASKMAFGIAGRRRDPTGIVLDADYKDDHSAMTGQIVSALYSKQKHW